MDNLCGIHIVNRRANATGVGYPNPESVSGTFSYTYSGTTNGGQLISGTATSSTVLPAGIYTLTATFTSTNPNYASGGTATTNVTIHQTTPAISWEPNTNLPSHLFGGSYSVYDMTYGTPFTAGELNATATNPKTGDAVAGTFTYKYGPYQVTDVVSIGTVLPVRSSQPSPANLYLIKAFFTADDTGDFTSNISTNFYFFEVEPAPLTVTANDQTMTYGGTVPTFTVSYNGFVNNDTSADLTGSVSCVVKGKSGNQIDPSTALPGTYVIDCSGSTLSDINYTISYAEGTLTINPIQTTTTATTNPSLTYGTTSLSLSATVSSADPNHPVNEGTATFTVAASDGTVLCSSQATAVSNGAVSDVPCAFRTAPGAGSYTITATYTDGVTNAIFGGSFRYRDTDDQRTRYDHDSHQHPNRRRRQRQRPAHGLGHARERSERPDGRSRHRHFHGHGSEWKHGWEQRFGYGQRRAGERQLHDSFRNANWRLYDHRQLSRRDG